MPVAGIVCEYNPFHEGHRYLIHKAKELTGAETVAVVMNGDFVQRGAPAVCDKYTRTRMALLEGADLVFELPVRYGISSAEDFAYGGILALDSLSFVDCYCFGSECGDTGALREAGQFFAGKSSDLAQYRASLKRLLRTGMAYPAAREKAFWECYQGKRLREGTAARGKASGECDQEGFPHRAALFAPNNILGMEYIRAAESLGSRMEPLAVRRCGMGYHDLDGECADGFLSATAIRENMKKGDFSGIPPAAAAVLGDAGYRLETEHFWTACFYALRSQWDELERFKDVSDSIATRFRNCLYEAVSFDDFVKRCKTKNVTMSRIRRCVFQVLLGVGKTAVREKHLPYIRLLGMRKEAAAYLKQVQHTVVLGRLSKDMERLGADGRRMLEQDLRASDLYRGVAMAVSGERMPDEYKRRLVTLP